MSFRFCICLAALCAILLYSVPTSAVLCSDDSKAKINMCVRVMSKFMDTETGHVVTSLCSDIGYSWGTKTKCIQMTKWIFAIYHVDGITDQNLKTAVVQAVRATFNIHNFCVTSLNTVPTIVRDIEDPPAKLISDEQRAVCILNTPRRGEAPARNAPTQLHALTGLRCLMFHGVGGKYIDQNIRGDLNRARLTPIPTVEAQLALNDDPTVWNGQPGDKYFGRDDKDMKKLADQLQGYCDVRFFKVDTYKRGWSHDNMQREYCSAIQEYQPNVIFTHSMGNLIIAGGIARGLPGCNRIKRFPAFDFDIALVGGNVAWFGVQGPLEGTQAIIEMKKVCNYNAEYLNGFFNWKDKLAWNNMVEEGRCLVNRDEHDVVLGGVLDAAYLTMEIRPDGSKYVNPLTGYNVAEAKEPQLTCAGGTAKCVTLKQIATEYQSGSMCGTSSHSIDVTPTTAGIGLTEMWSRVLNYLDPDDRSNLREWKIFKYGGFDGCLAYSSCALTGIQYFDRAGALYYSASVNHLEGMCHTDDSSAYSGQEPCSWYTEMVKLVRKKFFGAVGMPAVTFNLGSVTIPTVEFTGMTLAGFGLVEESTEVFKTHSHRFRSHRVHSHHHSHSHQHAHHLSHKSHSHHHNKGATEFPEAWAESFLNKGKFVFATDDCATTCNKAILNVFPLTCKAIHANAKVPDAKAPPSESKDDTIVCDVVHDICWSGCPKRQSTEINPSKCVDADYDTQNGVEFDLETFYKSDCIKATICQKMCYQIRSISDDIDDATCESMEAKGQDKDYIKNLLKSSCDSICKNPVYSFPAYKGKTPG
jgi:hypothetical protein